MKFFHARRTSYHTNAKLIDEVIYTPYAYSPASSSSDAKDHTQPVNGSSSAPIGDLLGIPELAEEEVPQEHELDFHRRRHRKKKSKFDATPTEAEIFIFNYGTVVIWGMTESQEKRFLTSMWVCKLLPCSYSYEKNVQQTIWNRQTRYFGSKCHILPKLISLQPLIMSRWKIWITTSQIIAGASFPILLATKGTNLYCIEYTMT